MSAVALPSRTLLHDLVSATFDHHSPTFAPTLPGVPLLYFVTDADLACFGWTADQLRTGEDLHPRDMTGLLENQALASVMPASMVRDAHARQALIVDAVHAFGDIALVEPFDTDMQDSILALLTGDTDCPTPVAGMLEQEDARLAVYQTCQEILVRGYRGSRWLATTPLAHVIISAACTVATEAARQAHLDAAWMPAAQVLLPQGPPER